MTDDRDEMTKGETQNPTDDSREDALDLNDAQYYRLQEAAENLRDAQHYRLQEAAENLRDAQHYRLQEAAENLRDAQHYRLQEVAENLRDAQHYRLQEAAEDLREVQHHRLQEVTESLREAHYYRLQETAENLRESYVQNIRSIANDLNDLEQFDLSDEAKSVLDSQTNYLETSTQRSTYNSQRNENLNWTLNNWFWIYFDLGVYLSNQLTENEDGTFSNTEKILISIVFSMILATELNLNIAEKVTLTSAFYVIWNGVSQDLQRN